MNDSTQVPHVAIILLHWNAYEDSFECLKSLAKLTYSSYSVYLVDNGSSDGSADELMAKFSDVNLVTNQENLGFSAGNNVGIKVALEQNPDYVLLLNNDTIVEPGLLEPAIKYGSENLNVGMIGGKIFFFEPSNKIWDAGGKIDWLKGHGRRIGAHEIDDGKYDQPRKSSFVTGCMMLIRRDVLDSVGLLPEEYFFGVEEWDYSVQVARAGYELAYVPDFVCWHKVGGSHSHLQPKWIYNYLRSRMLFMRRQASPVWYSIWYCMMWIHSWYKMAFQLPRLSNGKVHEVRKAIHLAFRDHGQKDRISPDDMKQFNE